jgi:chromosome segregation ATPase
MSIENIDQYIKELTAIKQYDKLIQQLEEKEKEIENLNNTLASRDQELGGTRQELSKWKAYAIQLNEVKIILDNNQNTISLADAAKAFLNTKQQEIDRKATEKFHILKKKWEDFDKPLDFKSYYDERIEQKVKEIEDKVGKNVFELLGGVNHEWKINCNKCGLGHTLKFNAKDISSLFQNGFIDRLQ